MAIKQTLISLDKYFESITKKEIDLGKVEKIQNIYNKVLPEEVQRIVSNAESSIFLDDVRILSYKEILNAEYDLHVDFKTKQMIPLADCGDNDFVVYHFDTHEWSKFNIIDEVTFKKRKTLAEVL